jgi:hypothetical protein
MGQRLASSVTRAERPLSTRPLRPARRPDPRRAPRTRRGPPRAPRTAAGLPTRGPGPRQGRPSGAEESPYGALPTRSGRALRADARARPGRSEVAAERARGLHRAVVDGGAAGAVVAGGGGLGTVARVAACRGEGLAGAGAAHDDVQGRGSGGAPASGHGEEAVLAGAARLACRARSAGSAPARSGRAGAGAGAGPAGQEE